jgi:predicted RNase H-like nuclease (RuvC/YqgF family)
MPESWQEWAAGAITFLSGLAAIWATLRGIRRKDTAHGRAMERADGEQDRTDQQNALKQCWEFNRKREAWYNAERQSHQEAIERQEELIRSLREEIHTTRNSWSQEQLGRVRTEEENKYLRAELADLRQEMDELKGRLPRGRPSPPTPPPPSGT